MKQDCVHMCNTLTILQQFHNRSGQVCVYVHAYMCVLVSLKILVCMRVQDCMHAHVLCVILCVGVCVCMSSIFVHFFCNQCGIYLDSPFDRFHGHVLLH